MASIIRYPSAKPLPLSRAVKAGGFVFLSGVLPADAEGRPVTGEIRVETRAVLQQIDTALAELGAGRTDVVRTTVWLADLGDFAAFNEKYARYFGEHLPARSTVQAVLNRAARVEVEVQAWVG
ncbi:RidA family protein [Xylophilus sp.]|uniref:RidA family protein n=1 Tax=Xylophilus sp. TaxID=2653893 RepID=UPI0013BC0DCE|nr:Rid family hydrolase [Xylophilus sp.]KAF1050107.1 MAG: 2-iminobutanoate/2-iminopropanoate deaminase [Xylophilus sp.]